MTKPLSSSERLTISNRNYHFNAQAKEKAEKIEGEKNKNRLGHIVLYNTPCQILEQERRRKQNETKEEKD